MPITNVRNAEAKFMQSTDFVGKQDHLNGLHNLHTLIKVVPGLADGWIFNQVPRNASWFPYFQGEFEIMNWTNSGGICAARDGGALIPFGLSATARLGEGSALALFADGAPHNTRWWSEGYTTTPGLFVMLGFYLPATSTPPSAGSPYKAFMTKEIVDNNPLLFDCNWNTHWRWTGTIAEIVVELNDGTVASNSAVGFQSGLVPSVGASHVIGFTYKPSTHVDIFMDNQYTRLLAPSYILNGHPNIIPAALRSTTDIDLCIARFCNINAAQPSYPSADAYYLFAMYAHCAIPPAQYLAMYHAIKPALGWNTNLGGT